MGELIGSTDANNRALARELHFHDNQIEKLPKNVSDWAKVRTLNLNKNNLQRLPAYIGSQMPNLRNLALSQNKLTAVFKQVFDCKGLYKLDLRDNEITDLPKEIAQLSQLRQLLLRGNRLRDLPDNIAEMQSLKFLDLRDNPNLPAGAGQRLQQLLPNCHLLF